MQKRVARFDALHGSTLAFIDQRMPGHERTNFNLIGLGVTENVNNPDMAPNIPYPAHGFAVGMIACEPGKGAALHQHPTEEVFMPLTGRWSVYWLCDGVEQEVLLDPFDMVSVPIGVYRGFRNAGTSSGMLFAILGGPDTGKVTWHPSVLEQARATGLAVDENGELRELSPA
jgi:mannose-6-phosphate isomerase-like protein (cupin superfamily)